jgi:predicted phage terminase large subunit-like protein
VYDPDRPPPEVGIDQEADSLVEEVCRRSLGDFVQHAWPVLEESTLLTWNWHLDALCDHVQSILEGKRPARKKMPRTGLPKKWVQNAIINVPPGTMKSLVLTVFAVAWKWLHSPAWRVICASGNPRVLSRDSLKCRELVTSKWYQKLFRPEWSISSDQNEKLLFKTTRGGSRAALSAGGAVTGDRADALLVDDPNDAGSVTSKAERLQINENWWDSAFHNRVNDPVRSVRVIVMQRLHTDDLTGHILEKEKLTREGGSWEQLVIPMEYEAPSNDPTKEPPPSTIPTWLGWTDPRTREGELLFPSRFPPEVLAQEKVTLGSAKYAGQMQQRPAPLEGNMFQRRWWRFWKEDGMPDVQQRPKGCSEAAAVVIPTEFDEVIESWDLSFKGKASNDWVVGLKIARKGNRKFITFRTRRHTGFGGAKSAILDMRSIQPYSFQTLVEDKANGPAVIEDLQAMITGIIPVNPEGGKEARASVMAPQVEAGEWFLPDGMMHWTDEFIEEFAVFPNGKHDDQVDAGSQAAIRLSQSSNLSYALMMCSK